LDKNVILEKIYTIIDTSDWSLPTVCGKGCATCCTANVMITAIEGEKILGYAVDLGWQQWLAERLAATSSHSPPQYTLNDFAEACLAGRELPEDPWSDGAPCPFLFNHCCRIYPVRPLACRLFASTELCRIDLPASVPQWYFDAATAVSQIVEHLGQKEYWGRMQDVLAALLDIRRYSSIAVHVEPTLIIQARLRTLTARPLPGYLFSEDPDNRISGLLHRLLDGEVDGRRLGDILGGR
jgi:Fe-S-cluster containining protein